MQKYKSLNKNKSALMSRYLFLVMRLEGLTALKTRSSSTKPWCSVGSHTIRFLRVFQK